ncbi:hypothetical protein EON65_15400 [archaeon]|nr:MAG: hypothetical protein EON65_15400 [archaeon]
MEVATEKKLGRLVLYPYVPFTALLYHLSLKEKKMLINFQQSLATWLVSGKRKYTLKTILLVT